MCNFTRKQPCNNCPYRKDAPLRHWSIEEYKDLLDREGSQFGSVYGCHKNDGHVCVGWLIQQHNKGFPSIALRMQLIKQKITREYLDALFCKSPMFNSVSEMFKANYPEYFRKVKKPNQDEKAIQP